MTVSFLFACNLSFRYYFSVQCYTYLFQILLISIVNLNYPYHQVPQLGILVTKLVEIAESARKLYQS